MPKHKEKHILVVDDDRLVTDLLSVSLKHEFFTVSVARDPQSGYQLVESAKPDLLVVDMMLPRKSGLDLVRMLQKPEYINIPVIIVSGELVDNEVRAVILLEPNVQDYFTKPIDIPKLVGRIHSLLDNPKK